MSKRLSSVIAFGLSASLLAACGGGGSSGGGGMPATPTPSPIPTATAMPASASECTFNNANPQSVARYAAPGTARRAPSRGWTGERFVPGTIEVLRSHGIEAQRALELSSQQIGATYGTVAGFETSNSALSVVHVAAGSERRAISVLLKTPGVKSAVQAQYRHVETAAVYSPNDPYWSHGGTGQPPFYQTDQQGGQWDMHLICVSRAWGYSQATGNSFGVVPGALAGNVKIAVIDTGVDTSHPDLKGKIAYTATYNSGNGTLVNTPMVDQDGHGTNVAGIAAADTNNAFGFVGAGFNAQIMAYRVFPNEPSGGCPPGSTSSQCESSTTDIAAAIKDAVAHGANVINLSLGGAPTGGLTCSTGGEDPAEAQAVSGAIAAGVIVVAASGNEGAGVLDCPGGDTGVIAVGASALSDNGIGTPVTGEHIASYSNYDASNPAGWGVTAPGGDPTAADQNPNNPTDFYHWIENIYTSTAVDGSSTAACAADQFNEVNNCKILIAGTSQATPHVAGIAALMVGAHPGATPASVAQILCSTALNIGDSHQGCGRVDAYRAVARILGDATVP